MKKGAASFGLLVLLAACGGGGGHSRNEQEPHGAPPTASAPPAPAPKANTRLEEPADDDPALDAMSPSRRRTYERGYRDCRAGRYAPEGHSEAYRIGCAAAQDGKAGAAAAR